MKKLFLLLIVAIFLSGLNHLNAQTKKVGNSKTAAKKTATKKVAGNKTTGNNVVAKKTVDQKTVNFNSKIDSLTKVAEKLAAEKQAAESKKIVANLSGNIDSLARVNEDLKNENQQVKDEVANSRVMLDTLRNNLEQQMAKNQGTSEKFNTMLAKHAADNDKTVENTPTIAKKDPVVKPNAPVAKNPVVVKPTKGHPLLNAKNKTFEFVASDLKDKDIAPTLEELEDLGWTGKEWPR